MNGDGLTKQSSSMPDERPSLVPSLSESRPSGMAKAFRQSEERYRTTFEHTGTAMWVCQDDVIVMTNQEFADWNNCSVADIEGKRRWQEFAHPLELARLEDYHQRRLGGDKSVPKQYETVFIDDLGRVRNVMLTTEMVPGTLMNVVSLMDITAWRRAQEQATRFGQYVERMLEQTNVWIDVVDERDCVVIWNQAAESISGYSRAEVVGDSKVWEWLYPDPDYRQAVRRHERSIRDARSFEEVESTIAARDGMPRVIRRYCGQLTGTQGEPVGAISLGRDVTEARAAEAQRAEMERRAQLASRLATVGEMASGIAHEINNPLTGILGFAELLLQRDLPVDVMEEIRTIHEAGTRLSQTVRRLLAFARPHRPERALVDLNDIVKTTVSLQRYQMEAGNIRLTLRLDPAIPQILADPGQLQILLLNLIINANTAMRLAHGRGWLRVETRVAGDTVQLSVKDDGPGIAADLVERIFEPFFTTNRDGQGTGLGLSICHTIVKEHRGRITVNTAEGKGTAMVVELPLQGPGPVGAPKRQRRSAASSRRRLPGRVLIVDDEAMVCRYLREGLTRDGVKVDFAQTAADARRLVASSEFDALLLDIRMPGVNGMDFHQALKTERPALARHTVVVTGDTSASDIKEYVEREHLRCLSKPLSLQTVRTELARVGRR